MRRFLTALVLAGAALGCGSGSGDGGGTAATGSAAAQGPILGFGSIYVAGDRWSTDGARIEHDDRVVGEDDLSLGMVVRVEGERMGPGRARATRIVFDDEVEGAIDAITSDGPDRLLLDVLGLVVVVDRGRTVFEATSFDTLAQDDVVEVSGLPDAGGRVLATFIEKKARLDLGDTEVELEGLAGAADPSAGTFEIRGIEIVVDAPGVNTEIDDGLGGFVANGDRVEVEGILEARDRILATRIEEEDDLPDALDDFEVEGIVTDFAGFDDFRVAGIAVDASGAVFVPDRPDLVRDGTRVEVEGTLRNSVLIARKVSLCGSEVRIHAAIASAQDIDPVDRVVTLLGVPIVVPGSLRLEDDRDELPGFGLEDLAPGDFLEVRGFDDGAGGVQASRIERREVDDVRLRGRIDAFDARAGTVVILGVRVPTDGLTEFENAQDLPIGRAAFFDALEIGALVEVDDADAEATSIDVADELSFEAEDDDGGFDD